jgi:hypothetical protein
MTISAKHERGYTFFTLAIILGLIGFFALLVLKIGPIYLDHSKVKSALAAIENTTDVETLTEPEIKSLLQKRFDLNYVNHAKMEDIVVTKRGSYLKVQIVYEVVEKIVGNLSVLVEFDDSFEVGQE